MSIQMTLSPNCYLLPYPEHVILEKIYEYTLESGDMLLCDQGRRVLIPDVGWAYGFKPMEKKTEIKLLCVPTSKVPYIFIVTEYNKLE